MKLHLSLLAACFYLLSYSQKHNHISDVSEISLIQKTSIYSYSKNPQSTEEQDVEYFLEREFNVELKSTYVRSSPVAHYYLFQQTYEDRSIFGAEIKVTLDRNGEVKRIDNSLLDIPNALEFEFINHIDPKLVKGNSPISEMTKQELIVYNNGNYIPALEAIVKYDNFDHIKYIFDSKENLLFKQSLNAHFTLGTDTTSKMMVFKPDPMTKAQVFWVNGNDYDMNDQNSAFLDPLRDTVSIELFYDNISNAFKLENDRCIIKEFSTPVVPIVTSTVPFFDYSRSNSGFEQVNAYYHITNTQKHLVNMGFDLVDYKIEVDVNALNGQDNSMFNIASNPPRLFFGEGGVDDAEDADVIIHEYGHAISHSANGSGNNTGTERRCLDEANGDYYAASYSFSVNPYKWENIFSWDGHNQYWNGRDGDNPLNKMYPISFTSGNIYSHTDLWVCPLMEIYMAIGKFKTDQIVTESLYGYFPNMTFTDAALLIVQADSAYNGGANVSTIWTIFNNKGILPSSPISIFENNVLDVLVLGTQFFAQGSELTVINRENDLLKIKVLDLNGRLIYDDETFVDLKIDGSLYKPGVYLLVIENENGNVQTEKLIKY